MKSRRGSRFHAALNRRRWTRVRREVLARDGWRCVECGRPGRLEAHHIQPLHKGGAPFDLENIETRCRGCHIEAHRRQLTPGEAAWKALVDNLLRFP